MYLAGCLIRTFSRCTVTWTYRLHLA